MLGFVSTTLFYGTTWLKIRILQLSVKVAYIKFQENLSSSIGADTGSRTDVLENGQTDMTTTYAFFFICEERAISCLLPMNSGAFLLLVSVLVTLPLNPSKAKCLW
jgi:hypothetical protein